MQAIPRFFWAPLWQTDHDEEVRDALDRVPHRDGSPNDASLRSRTETREWLQERIDGRVAVAVGVAWFVLNEIAFALEPASQQSVPVIGIVLEVTMYVLARRDAHRARHAAPVGAARVVRSRGARDRSVDRVPGHGSPCIRYVVVRTDGVHARARHDQRRRATAPIYLTIRRSRRARDTRLAAVRSWRATRSRRVRSWRATFAPARRRIPLTPLRTAILTRAATRSSPPRSERARRRPASTCGACRRCTTASPGPSTIGSTSGSANSSRPEIMMSTSIVSVVCHPASPESSPAGISIARNAIPPLRGSSCHDPVGSPP